MMEKNVLPVEHGKPFMLNYFRSIDGVEIECDPEFEGGEISVYASDLNQAREKARNALADNFRKMGYSAEVDEHGVTVYHGGAADYYYGFDED